MTNFLLVTSNGAGMGHLTRQAAVALAMDRANSATVFSLSLGLPLVTALGVAGEYCPSYDRPWVATRNWNSYLRDRLVAIARETAADVVLFDGVAPYPGLAHAARAMRDVAFVWLRRGMWKETNLGALGKGRFFDLVIEPGDLASRDDTGPTSRLDDSVKVGPISILEPLELLPREEARRRLGLPQDRPVALVTLGSGRLGDVAGPGRVALETLLEDPAWHVAVTRSPVALNEVPTNQAERVTRLSRVYPLAIYLSAFDAAVSSAGYNAVHELIPAGVPTVLVANTSTRTDDQVARATSLERQGLAVAAADDDLATIEDRVRAITVETARSELRERAAETLNLITGAQETGATASAFAAQFSWRRRSISESLGAGMEKAKEITRATLGEERTERLKRLLGRRPTPVHERSTVKVVDSFEPAGEGALALAVLRSLDGAALGGDQPIEHVLPTGSLEYEMGRREIIDHYYDVVP